MDKLLRKLFYSKLMLKFRNEYSEKLERINIINGILMKYGDDRISSINKVSEVIQVVANNWTSLSEKEQDELSLILAGGRNRNYFMSYIGDIVE